MKTDNFFPYTLIFLPIYNPGGIPGLKIRRFRNLRFLNPGSRDSHVDTDLKPTRISGLRKGIQDCNPYSDYYINLLSHDERWRKYSGLVLCKSRGNSGVTASTSRHWKPQESSLWRWFHIAGKCHTGLGVALPVCDGGLGRGVGRSALLVVGFSVLVSILLRSLSMSGAALSTWLMGALRLRGSCLWLGERKGHEWLATCVQDVLSQGILSSSTTCGISGCSEEALHVTASWW